jgi:hypothetical protein
MTVNWVKLKVRIFSIVVFILFSFLILSVFLSAIIMVRQSYALLQVAGNITVEVMPGENETFTWGLISDKNGSSTVNITADGVGAEYLSFPENITLAAGGQITYVPVNVSIPSNYTGPTELTPSIIATEAGEAIGQTIINVAMSKTLCVIVGSENNTTILANQNVTGLELKDYTQEVVVVGNNDTSGNQSIMTISIRSTSENITGFSLNQLRNEISFTASGEAGTNGTTIIFLDQILQEPYSLMVDGTPSTDFENITNSTTGERGIQITYRHHCIDNNIVLTGSEEGAAQQQQQPL